MGAGAGEKAQRLKTLAVQPEGLAFHSQHYLKPTVWLKTACNFSCRKAGCPFLAFVETAHMRCTFIHEISYNLKINAR